ncbi:hypothetical protein Q4489_18080 [Thalassotalea sp. 1_MG-2023]|uniref:hypothetical protein n=1 Tax=Thalassotalea sp. 1_MG-2023 TaxID=3062680 RepID=UPI0026E3F306|nr:hypothetical protein [Thalassotalea sp. 1_MG-2023]MDO6428911.1 hypothetical protein [Thalassotalea sp. 1_MG-2023]
MSRIFISIFIFISTITLSFSSYGLDKSPATDDRYFGETPPSLIPIPFTPSIPSVDGKFENGIFSPDMQEFYFTTLIGKEKKRASFVVYYENNQWGEAIKTDFKWPMFSVDGTKMYIGKSYREKTKTGWSESKPTGAFLKEQAHGLSVSSNGTFFFPFFKKEDKGRGNLGYSRIENGQYQSPVKLATHINQGQYIAHPHISPDESYLMWDVEREDNLGSNQPDIYISFKESDGSWGPAINMGSKINTALYEQSPHLSPDGKYLFFIRGEYKKHKDGTQYWQGSSYWVSAQVIDNIRPKL